MNYDSRRCVAFLVMFSKVMPVVIHSQAANCKHLENKFHTPVVCAMQGPDMTNPCCKVWLDGAKAIPVDDRPDRPPGCNLVSPLPF